MSGASSRGDQRQQRLRFSSVKGHSTEEPRRPVPTDQHEGSPRVPQAHESDNALMPSTHPFFRRSKCTGRRRALCIGINYLGQSHALRGCIVDAKQAFIFLVRYAGYRAEEIVVLTDDSPNPRGQPTKQNMIKAMKWLVRGAKQDDALFFHYSGHGGQTPDRDGFEGFDDVIFPVDFEQAGQILDHEMHEIMVKPLPPGCRLTAIFDSCHSGTVLDLPYMYNHHGLPKMHRVSARARRRDASPADVISIGGCKDDETSADTFEDGGPVGAASYAFIKAIKAHPNGSYKDLINNMHAILHAKYSQNPQLGSSHPIDTGHKFIM